MIVKSYTAATVAAALKEIREELGGEAIVLRTRLSSGEDKAHSGRRFEVTACVDEQLARSFRKRERNLQAVKRNDRVGMAGRIEPDNTGITAADAAAPEKVDLQKRIAAAFKPADITLQSNRHSRNIEPELTAGGIDEQLKPIRTKLTDSDVPADIVDQLTAAIAEKIKGTGIIDQVAREVLCARLTAHTRANIRIENGSRIAFIGPSGAGKTSVLGKVAAYLCAQHGQRVKLVSIKSEKLPVPDEIGVYGAHLDIPVEPPEEILKAEKDESIVLIDTPPVSRDGDKMSELIDMIRKLDPDLTFFIFSACMRTRDLLDAIKAYGSAVPDYLVATHLDETRRWGSILAVIEYMNIPLAFVTDSPGGTGHLMAPDPSIMANQLLKPEGDLDD